MGLGGHIHPNFFRINLLISLNLMKKVGVGLGVIFLLRDRYLFLLLSYQRSVAVVRHFRIFIYLATCEKIAR